MAGVPALSHSYPAAAAGGCIGQIQKKGRKADAGMDSEIYARALWGG